MNDCVEIRPSKPDVHGELKDCAKKDQRGSVSTMTSDEPTDEEASGQPRCVERHTIDVPCEEQ